MKLVTEQYPDMFKDRVTSDDNSINLRPCDGWSDGAVMVEDDRTTRNLVDWSGTSPSGN